MLFERGFHKLWHRRLERPVSECGIGGEKVSGARKESTKTLSQIFRQQKEP